MDAQILFNKDQYYPGEIVEATFIINGPFHGRSRELILELISGEDVGVVYHTGSGKNRRQKVAWSKLAIAEAREVLPVPEMGSLTYSLKYRLPPTPLDSHLSQYLRLYHQARVKLDISMASDEEVVVNIPIVSIPLQEMQKIAAKGESLNFVANINQSSGYTGDIVSLQLLAKQSKKYRSIRVELEQVVNKQVGRHRKRIARTTVLTTSQPMDLFLVDLPIPELSLSSLTGQAFEVSTFLKVVIDIAFATDENIVFDFPYFKGSRDLHANQKNVSSAGFCHSCGSPLELNAKFCPECGTSID
ncbi:MAG: zinc-ribbon domain-containing protein [Candidatus Heimdallarchaeota archaeon]|nr:zinc-ribbon domain-containing protein [Candidatus Heimdallarchaeota archaeon]